MVYGSRDYSKLEEIIGYHFKDKHNLDIAFTHKSYANEKSDANIISYERYEFLGDAILQFLSSKRLFMDYPEKTEGELTKLRASLVCEHTLSQITKELGFGTYLYLSHGEFMTGGQERPSILCDLFESVLGAIYLDGGMEPAERYVDKFLMTDIEKKTLFFDAKSKLQEYAQKYNMTLEYKLIAETGPDHNKNYEVQVLLDGKPYEKGRGHTIKAADQIAAHSTLIKLHYGE